MGSKFGYRQKARGDFSRKFRNGKKMGGGKSFRHGESEYKRNDFNRGKYDNESD